MFLPEYVRACIQALEDRGFPTYAVGGCVRDALLGLTPQDYDLCTQALPGQIRETFSHCRLVLAGEKHGTVTVVLPEGAVEITTFRLEGDYTDSRHPGWVKFVSRVDSDLSRRDFTVNAMAFSPTRGLQDPFGGQEDLRQRRLRAVGEPERRFSEDALRILRGVRFSARYGLTPEPETLAAMFRLAPGLDSLARERVFDELSKLLPLLTRDLLLRFFPILSQVIPELAPMAGFDQKNPHHDADLLTHTARVVEAVPPTPALRWAALLHDVGKPGTFTLDEKGIGHFYGHAGLGADMAEAVLRRLKAPTSLREQVSLLIRLHMNPLEPDKKLLRRALGKHGAETVEALLALQQADIAGPGSDIDFEEIRALIREILAEADCLTLRQLAVKGSDLLALGIPPGPALGRCLEALLAQVQNEALPNEKQALLESDICRQALEIPPTGR